MMLQDHAAPLLSEGLGENRQHVLVARGSLKARGSLLQVVAVCGLLLIVCVLFLSSVSHEPGAGNVGMQHNGGVFRPQAAQRDVLLQKDHGREWTLAKSLALSLVHSLKASAERSLGRDARLGVRTKAERGPSFEDGTKLALKRLVRHRKSKLRAVKFVQLARNGTGETTTSTQANTTENSEAEEDEEEDEVPLAAGSPGFERARPFIASRSDDSNSRRDEVGLVAHARGLTGRRNGSHQRGRRLAGTSPQSDIRR
eukprot:768626-Hanusia_phi.AAC.12